MKLHETISSVGILKIWQTIMHTLSTWKSRDYMWNSLCCLYDERHSEFLV